MWPREVWRGCTHWMAGLSSCHSTTQKKACERMSCHVARRYAAKLVRSVRRFSSMQHREMGTMHAAVMAKIRQIWLKERDVCHEPKYNGPFIPKPTRLHATTWPSERHRKAVDCV